MANGFCKHGGSLDRCGELGTMGGIKSLGQGKNDELNMIEGVNVLVDICCNREQEL